MLSFIIQALVALIKKLVGVLADLIGLGEYFARLICGSPAQSTCPPCPPAIKRPDPFIYDQYYLAGLGYPITWDNPDIYIFESGTPVDPHNLKANTTYTVVARIWNNSLDVPVVGLLVHFSYLSFGMATESHQIGSSTTNLNARGLPGCPAFAYIDWTTPAQKGHYCLQVLLEPPDDSNWMNNLGQRNTDVTQPQSTAKFAFSVGNHVRAHIRNVDFEVDAYVLPPLPMCREAGASGRQISRIPPPVPTGWTVVLTPDRLTLRPGHEERVSVEIGPPVGFSGAMSFNVTAHDNGAVIGGVTLRVEVP
jgi:hypothetical protein